MCNQPLICLITLGTSWKIILLWSSVSAHIHTRQWRESKGKQLPEAAAELQNCGWRNSTNVVCSFLRRRVMLMSEFSDIFTRKDERNIKEKKKLMQTTLSFVSFMFFSSVRSNMSTWYLRSCLQFCDNVYIAYLN